MDLATFPESVAWLNRFDDEDRETATLLLQRLRCISPTVFHNEGRGLFEAAATSLDTPIALYAAREMTPATAYFSDKRRRPIIVDLSKGVGSEGNSAYLATTLARERPDVFLNHPPIATLKKKLCRSIVVFDDVCGSGKRVAEFISAILMEKTLKSWLSGGSKKGTLYFTVKVGCPLFAIRHRHGLQSRQSNASLSLPAPNASSSGPRPRMGRPRD